MRRERFNHKKANETGNEENNNLKVNWLLCYRLALFNPFMKRTALVYRFEPILVTSHRLPAEGGCHANLEHPLGYVPTPLRGSKVRSERYRS